MKTITAIICVTLITITALIMGYNGVLFAVAISAVTGLGGYTLGRRN